MIFFPPALQRNPLLHEYIYHKVSYSNGKQFYRLLSEPPFYLLFDFYDFPYVCTNDNITRTRLILVLWKFTSSSIILIRHLCQI